MEKNIKIRDIQNIVKKNLQERYLINETLSKISLNEDENIKLIETVDMFNDLIEEGYDEESIKRIVEEQFDSFSKLFSGLSYDGLNPSERLIGTGGGAAYSQFKEYLIDKFLSLLGFKGPLAKGISTAMSEMKFKDIIVVFSSRSGCMLHSNVIAKGLIEGISRTLLEHAKIDSLGSKMIRQVISEIIHRSGYTRYIGQQVCTAAYKIKSEILSKKNTTTNQPPPEKTPKELG